MKAALKPMSLGEILDRTIHIYRSRFWIFMGIAALPALATTTVMLASDLIWGPFPPYSIEVVPAVSVFDLGTMLAFYHFSLFFQILVWPAFLSATSKIIFDEAHSIASALRTLARRWRRQSLFSALLLIGTLGVPEVIGAAILLGIGALFSEVLKEGEPFMDLVMPVLLLTCCIGGWIGIGWMNAELAFAAPATVFEEAKIFKSIRRAWKFTRGTRFRVFAAWLMPAIVSLAANTIVAKIQEAMRSSCKADLIFRIDLVHLLQVGWRGWCVPMPVVEIVRLSSTALVTTMVAPIFPIALTLLYYDQRVRLEGYDIELLMTAAGMESPLPQAPIPPSAESPVPTSAETHAAN